MSEPQALPSSDRGALARTVAEAVLAVPGVERLEPTLIGRVGRWTGSLVGREPAPVGQGLDLDLTGNSAAVTVDVAASTTSPLLDTARAVQTAVSTALDQHGIRCVSVTVSVLALGT